MKLRQATAVAIGGRAVLIEGPPGCGKSTLALSLVDRGAVLVGDDGVAIEQGKGELVARPPEASEGLVEIRNVGLVRLPCTTAPVALVLAIDPKAPRFIEQAETLEIEGFTIPFLRFALGGSADALRAEYALAQHGLPPPHGKHPSYNN